MSLNWPFFFLNHTDRVNLEIIERECNNVTYGCIILLASSASCSFLLTIAVFCKADIRFLDDLKYLGSSSCNSNLPPDAIYGGIIAFTKTLQNVGSYWSDDFITQTLRTPRPLNISTSSTFLSTKSFTCAIMQQRSLDPIFVNTLKLDLTYLTPRYFSEKV